MDQLHGREIVGREVQLCNPSKKTLDKVVAEIKKESFKGLICAFDMRGKILYRNDRVRLFLKEGTFFDMISTKERLEVIEELRKLYARGKTVEQTKCSIPLFVGRHLIEREKIKGELVTFSEGLVLKIPESVLENIIETELERLKLLLLKYPEMGLFIVDEHGRIIDLLTTSSVNNLLWREEELLGKEISTITSRAYDGDEEIYEVERIRKDGVHVKAKVTEGRVILSNKKKYKVYLDTYFS
ncbi:MAG: hypothetical protein FJZ59_03035 [Chlamydiae bacterium]|jgi:hypothetical protein|nr:hypothetical protein [Chlamydiota bacterium]